MRNILCNPFLCGEAVFEPEFFLKQDVNRFDNPGNHRLRRVIYTALFTEPRIVCRKKRLVKIKYWIFGKTGLFFRLENCLYVRFVEKIDEGAGCPCDVFLQYLSEFLEYPSEKWICEWDVVGGTCPVYFPACLNARREQPVADGLGIHVGKLVLGYCVKKVCSYGLQFVVKITFQMFIFHCFQERVPDVTCN
ncbi:MAG: hypothetical protein BWX90_01298 [bacterium ADurb.Bin132]|nr:MAG: hypothetical protein BWX90_01298 [bacterium ADurb.Bin132]